MGKIRCNF